MNIYFLLGEYKIGANRLHFKDLFISYFEGGNEQWQVKPSVRSWKKIASP
ncbi:hypothetical protein SAMN05443246_0341 [Paenibacillus sp. GP183]|nr:hypothetical protein SAMN05443246_0341 [Paenibacillus sp. GP183]